MIGKKYVYKWIEGLNQLLMSCNGWYCLFFAGEETINGVVIGVKLTWFVTNIK